MFAKMIRRGKYQSLTLKKKLEIISRVENLPPGKKKKDIASEFGIAQSTLSTILKGKHKIQASSSSGSTKKKRHRESTKPEVDAALFQWFTAARAEAIPISGEMYAVAIILNAHTVVGHVPIEFGKVAWYFLQHGGRIKCTITGHRQLSDEHGKGLEVPCSYRFSGMPKLIKKLVKLMNKQ